MRDERGLELTTDSPAAVAALAQSVTALLAHRAELATHLQAALAADPGLVAARCLAGFGSLMQARAALQGPALAHLGAARAALRQRGGTAREAALVDALADWAERGDMAAAATRLEGVLRAVPLDAMALKLAHGIRFMLGDAPAMRLAVESALPAWDATVPGHGYILGCHAFALEETGARQEAERTGRQAVAQAPDDLWGAHAVAHVMEGDGRARQGLGWIAELGPRIAAGGAFGRHIHWHAALFHLHLDEADAALALFDAQLALPSEDVRDFANAASLLWRLEAQGMAVGGARWDALAELATQAADQPGLAFIDLHHVLALGAAGRQAALATKLEAMRQRAMTQVDSQARVVARLGLPAAQGIAAALRGDAAEAVALLLPLRPMMQALGGSAAQRDLFERLLIQSCLAAGRGALAALLLRDRAGLRALGAWEARCAPRPALAA
jgi:hypothetical protein